MGWQSDDAPSHEGFLVGVIEDPTAHGGWRELRHPTDNHGVTNISMFQVACECGWRSPRFRAPLGTTWRPSIVELPELHDALRDVARDLWSQHWHLPDALAARAETRVPRAGPAFAEPSDQPSEGGRLDLADDSGGLRHYLLGRPVHAADTLQLLLADGRWLTGRYENQRGDDVLHPLFYFTLPSQPAEPEWAARVAGPSTVHLEALVQLPPNACLRWPPR